MGQTTRQRDGQGDRQSDHQRDGQGEDREEGEAERRAELIEQLWTLGQTYSTENALFHQVAAAKYDLGVTDMKALSVLLQEGPMTAGRLTARLNLTTGAVTSVIDRLERRGFVRRAPDPHDRRKVIVHANQERLDAQENIYDSIGQAFSALFATYPTRQLEDMAQFFRTAIDLIQREIAKLNARGD